MPLPPIHPCDHMHPQHDKPSYISSCFLIAPFLLFLSTLFTNDPSYENQNNLPNMPLVVPGLTSNSGDNDQTNKWMNELVGKKLGDSSNETVR